MIPANVLVVDDELDIRELIQEILSDEGYEVTVAASASEAKLKRVKQEFDLILLDIWMPEMDGITLLKEWADNDQLNSAVVMMSGHGTVDTAIESTHLGAVNFVEKPLSITKLLRTVEDALATTKPKLGPIRTSNLTSFVSIGHSELIQSLRKELKRVALVDSPVLIVGETGTGRLTYAHFLHDISQRSDNPCIDMDSAMLTSANTEEQIFGKEDGDSIVPGFFEKAEAGTLIINHLSNLNDRAQQIFQNILENKAFLRVNGKDKYTINSRVIAIVNEDYMNDVLAGKLKRELLSNLNIQTVHIPSLREHAEDVPDFIKFYVDQFIESEQMTYRRFSVAAQNRLRNFPWPGNLRELQSIIRKLLIKGCDDDVLLDELEDEFKTEETPIEPFVKKDLLSLSLREAREQFERAYLQQQLILCDGKVGKLAKRVGVERTHLYRKLKALNISLEKK